jgi:hypothetical protein
MKPAILFFFLLNKFIPESLAYNKLQKLIFWNAVICAWFTLRYFLSLKVLEKFTFLEDVTQF